jgi:hypothetical protein
MTANEKRDFILQDRDWSYFAYLYWHPDFPLGLTVGKAYKVASKG